MAGTRRTKSQYSFIKALYDELLLPTSGSLRRSSPRSGRIKHVDIHHMTIPDSDDGAANRACVATWRVRQASAHYGIDNDNVAQFVYDNRMAWGNANGQANQEGLIVEHANSTIGDKAGWKISELTLQTSAKVVAGLHIIHKLGRPTSIGFGTGGTIRTHRSFFATACPGPYFQTHWKRYVGMVQAAYDRMIAPTTTPPVVIPPVVTPKPTAKVAVWNKPETWVLGAVGPDVKRLGDRIVVWSKALGLPPPYKVGPGEPLGPADISALSKIQLKWWPGSSTTKGGDADGYPGMQSFAKLASNPVAPPVEEDKLTITGLFWNIAGSDTTNGYKKTNGSRGEPLGKYAKSLGFDVFLACEAGQKDLRAGVSKGLGMTSWMQRAKAIWHVKGIVRPKYQTAYSDGVFAYLKTTKWGAAFFGKKDGKLFSYLQIHTDWRSPAKQAKQVQSIFKKWKKDCDKLNIPVENRIVVGDFNWDYTSGDNPFNALEDWGFVDQGPKNKTTFMERKRLDGVIAHKNANVSVSVMSRSNGKYRLSDHNPIRFKHVLK